MCQQENQLVIFFFSIFRESGTTADNTPRKLKFFNIIIVTSRHGYNENKTIFGKCHMIITLILHFIS